jgi:hypothetical protein
MNSKQIEEVLKKLDSVKDDGLKALFITVLSRLEALEAAQAGLGKEKCNHGSLEGCEKCYPAPKEETTPPCTCDQYEHENCRCERPSCGCGKHKPKDSLAEKIETQCPWYPPLTRGGMAIEAAKIAHEHYLPLLEQAKVEERERLESEIYKLIETKDLRLWLGHEQLLRARDVKAIFDEVSK